MKTTICAALICAAAVALTSVAVTPADAQTQNQKQKRQAAKKKLGPVPVSMAPPPRARITVQRRTYLDAGTHVIPGDRKFMDYAIPPGYSPTAVIDNRAGVYIDQTALPGPFTLPGRDNPYPWNWCVGC
jgi:hypothetical protein